MTTLNTFALYDVNLTGPVVWTEDCSPENQAEYINENAGRWFDPSGQGKLIVSDEWELDVFIGQELDDVTDLEPDQRFTHLDMAPLKDLVTYHVETDRAEVLLLDIVETLDGLADTDTYSTIKDKVRALVKEYADEFANTDDDFYE